MDGLSNFLQSLEVLDVVFSEASLLQQLLVDDDAVALVAVADGTNLALSILQDIGVGVQLVEDVGIGQIQAVLAPSLDGGSVTDDEHGGSLGLVHLCGQSLVVGTGSSGDDLDGNTGLLGVHSGQLLQSLIGLGLKVQPVDGTGVLGCAAGKQTCDHQASQQQSNQLFHVFSSIIVIYAIRQMP